VYGAVPGPTVKAIAAVSLDDALRLVQLYAMEDSPKFEPAARKWLTRYLQERSPSLLDFARMVALLADLRMAEATPAELDGWH
jgi:hypothetical protein